MRKNAHRRQGACSKAIQHAGVGAALGKVQYSEKAAAAASRVSSWPVGG